MAISDKKQHWQDVVLEEVPGLAGTYDRPAFTVNKYGLLTGVSPSTIPMQTVVATQALLPGIPAPATGDLAIVLDNGALEEEMYLWNALNSDLGAPLNKWRLLATTEMTPARVNFRQSTVGIAANTPVGAPTSLDAKIKSISVTITSIYDPGIMMRVSEAAGSIWMNTPEINTQLTGTYVKEIPENDVKLFTTGQVQVELIGGPTVGSALVYVEYIVQP